MKSLLLFCYTCLLIGPSNRTLAQSIKTSAVTTLHITAENLTSSLPLATQIYHVFPAYDVSEMHDSLSSHKNQAWLRCPVRVTQNAFLTIGQDQLNLWLIPGDTVHIQVVSLTSPLVNRYRFQGITQAEQEYYLAKRVQFTTDLGQIGMNAGVQAKNLIAFRRQLDSLTHTEQSFWKDYQQAHRLSARFNRFESDAIRYNDAMLRLYMTWYQIDYQKKKQVVPANYYFFLNQLPARNAAAQYDYAYINFLREYVGWKLKTSTPNVADEDYKSELFRVADQVLGNDLGGYFKLWTISAGAQDNPERARTELTTTVFPTHYRYLLTYLKQRSAKKSTVLVRGDKAPSFFLPDTRDSLISLSQFKGQAVYLCFWFATCGGCFHEFPYENQLVEQFKGQPVQIVSICTITQPDKWRATIGKVGLRTINLLANPAWQKTLEEKYAISVYPHYVLIDANGRIVENFATRPSHNAAAKIKQVVAKIGAK